RFPTNLLPSTHNPPAIPSHGVDIDPSSTKTIKTIASFSILTLKDKHISSNARRVKRSCDSINSTEAEEHNSFDHIVTGTGVFEETNLESVCEPPAVTDPSGICGAGDSVGTTAVSYGGTGLRLVFSDCTASSAELGWYFSATL
ncbi:unnamed protein product, partial [Porites evermanni]